MPREEAPRREDQPRQLQTGTAWDALFPAISRFTNSVADYTRDELHIPFGVSHDTDLGPHKRQRFIAAGGTITHAPGQRGNPTYTFGGEEVGKKRAFQIVRQIKRGLIPAHPPGPPVVTPPPPNGGSAADQATGSYINWGTLAHYGPQRRSKRKKKKKSKLRSAAAVLAATAQRALQTGEEVFSDLLNMGRSASRYVEPEFDRLLKKGPVSDFERLLHDKPYRAPLPDAAPIARAAVGTAARAAGALALLLWPSSIGQEPPWSPPAGSVRTRVRPGRRPTRPRPLARPYALPQSEPGPSTPRPLPHLESRPFPAPVANPSPQTGARPSPAPAPYPVAAPSPLPGPSPRATPSAAPRPSPLASWLTFASPLAAGFAAPMRLPKNRPRVVALPQQFPSPLTQPKPEPSESRCDCSKPSRTKRERKERCTNPVISRSRTGDTLTITRRIKCPASSRKRP